MAKLQQFSTSPMLIALIGMLKSTAYFFVMTALIAGGFYLFVSLQRDFLLNKDEIMVKRLNGSSSLMIASECFAEQFISLPIIFICSLIISKRFFLTSVNQLDEIISINNMLPLSQQALSNIQVSTMILLLCATLICCYFIVKNKIVSLEHKK